MISSEDAEGETVDVSPDNIIEVKERLHEVYDDSEEEA